jgi:hypothetical protein
VILGVYSGHGVTRESERAAAPEAARAKTTARILACAVICLRAVLELSVPSAHGGVHHTELRCSDATEMAYKAGHVEQNPI